MSDYRVEFSVLRRLDDSGDFRHGTGRRPGEGDEPQLWRACDARPVIDPELPVVIAVDASLRRDHTAVVMDQVDGGGVHNLLCFTFTAEDDTSMMGAIDRDEKVALAERIKYEARIAELETEVGRWKGRQRSTEQKLGYEERLRARAEAALMGALDAAANADERRMAAGGETQKWRWVATHRFVCPLGEMEPGEPGSYVEERHGDIGALVRRWEKRGDHA